MRSGTQKPPQVKKELCRVLDYVETKKKVLCKNRQQLPLYLLLKWYLSLMSVSGLFQDGIS